MSAATLPRQTFTAGTGRVTVAARRPRLSTSWWTRHGLTAGRYSAQVAARYAGGEVHTAIGVAVESEKYDLTIHLKDRAGRP